MSTSDLIVSSGGNRSWSMIDVVPLGGVEEAARLLGWLPFGPQQSFVSKEIAVHHNFCKHLGACDDN